VDSTLLRLRVWRSPCRRARTASEGSLEVVEPFPGLVGASLLRRNAVSHHDHTDPPTDRVLSTTSLTPHPAHNKAGDLYGKSPNKHG
jgi:hypothetical protein